MLKRHQILLEDWQVKHYKAISEKLDVSFSEMIRLALCVDVLYTTKAAFPKYKSGLNEKQLKKGIRSWKLTANARAEEFHKFVSKFYFETRKSSELWQQKLKKGKWVLAEKLK